MTDKYHRTGRVLVGADLLIKLRFNGGRLIFSRVAQSYTYQHHHPPTNQCTNKSYIQPNNKIQEQVAVHTTRYHKLCYK